MRQGEKVIVRQVKLDARQQAELVLPVLGVGNGLILGFKYLAKPWENSSKCVLKMKIIFHHTDLMASDLFSSHPLPFSAAEP